jgi:hypothetical protein
MAYFQSYIFALILQNREGIRERNILSNILVIAVIPAVSPQTLLAITVKIYTGVKQASPILKVHLRDALFLFLHPHYLSIFAIIYNIVIF